jgi:DNA processing protein
MERDELAAWLRLLETPQVGRATARKLLAALGSPQAVLDASSGTLRDLVGPAAASALSAPPDGLDALVTTTQQWLCEAAPSPRAVISLGDPAYPQSLLETADPPLLLYAQGQLALLKVSSVAVVGSRNPTRQGTDNARAFARHLSQASLTVVSGLALGIDGAAHEGGLEGPGSTIAVVGTGLDRVYPKQHLELAHRIAREGLMLSEYAVGTPPLQAHFPQRNRLIAGLTHGTLVVEAALQSGSLITARLASEAGREVFAIPGSIHSPQSKGCHALIKQGAKLVEEAQDILEELSHALAAPARPIASQPVPDSRKDPLLDALGYDPVSLDTLSARTGHSAQELSAKLLEMELTGQVARLPGQLFQRVGLG